MAKGWTVAVVSALVGAGMAAGVVGWFRWRRQPTTPSQQLSTGPASPQPTPVRSGGQGRGVTGATPMVNREQAAIVLIQNLYQALSAKNWAEAAKAYTPAMQAQFDPTFFAQFTRVTVYDLRLMEQTPDRLELIGRNTYFYLDGTTQEEERSYTVVWQDGRPLIADSRFLRVLKPRS